MQPNNDLTLIEGQHPHIAKALKLLWGFPEADTYITKLLDDDRAGTRRGFSPEVMTALLNIQDQHKRPVKDDEPSTWGDSREFFR